MRILQKDRKLCIAHFENFKVAKILKNVTNVRDGMQGLNLAESEKFIMDKIIEATVSFQDTDPMGVKRLADMVSVATKQMLEDRNQQFTSAPEADPVLRGLWLKVKAKQEEEPPQPLKINVPVQSRVLDPNSRGNHQGQSSGGD